jgi:hypothetical protein
LIRGGFQIVNYTVQLEEGGKMYPPELRWVGTGRTLESYTDGRSHGDALMKYAYMTEAMKFAENNWGGELILDSWDSVDAFLIQDPMDLDQNQYPRTKVVLYVTFNRSWDDMLNDYSRPRSELMNDAVVQMSTDAFVWQELTGGRSKNNDFNCACCASGLDSSGCLSCGHKFKDDGVRCSWNTPLSRKMVEFLQQHGYVFEKDPSIAWRSEQQRFARNFQGGGCKIN